MSPCRHCRPVDATPPSPLPPTFRPGRGRWVTEAQLAARLAVCHACPSLTDGHTCAGCGCYVGWRAALKDKRCPHPHGDRWPV